MFDSDFFEYTVGGDPAGAQSVDSFSMERLMVS
jgi:hypothetical protein